MHIHWKRLIWVIFICLYTSLFFYNFHSPYNNWFISYIYTMVFIVWLGVEYYERRLFFQSGFVPAVLYSWPLRTLFALFFYSSFVIGNATIVWWQKNQTGLYPFIQIIGLALLAVSIYLRRQFFRKKIITDADITRFYLSVAVLICSIALGYGSVFLIVYVIVIGLPLIYLQRGFEIRQYKRFQNFAFSKQKIDKVGVKEYNNLWHRFIEKQLKKRGKK
jgi:hypothetical protein